MIVTAAALMLMLATAGSFAASPVRDTDVYYPEYGNTLVMIEGKFILVPKDKILDRINAIRLEACKEGVPDPRDTSRKLTKSDYVPLKWSSDLEWLAQTRAAEASLTRVHDRPNGGRFSSITYNGLYSQAEILAWNTGADTMHGIDQWYGEKKDWVKKSTSAVTGHYKQMISPENTYIGLATFLPAGNYGAICGEFRRYAPDEDSPLDESQTGVSGKYKQVIEVANNHLTITPKVPSVVQTGTTKKAGFTGQTKFVKNSKSILFDVTLYGPDYWSSSDENILFVDKLGNMTGIAEGDATAYAYFGNDVKEFKIRVQNISLPKPANVKLTKGKKSITVKWTKKTGVKGYKIQYGLKKDFSGAKTVTVKSYKTTSKKISKLKGKKRYYVRMRTYKIVDGKTYYSEWSQTESVVPKK